MATSIVFLSVVSHDSVEGLAEESATTHALIYVSDDAHHQPLWEGVGEEHPEESG